MERDHFLHPPTSLRPAPFWSINDKITPEECARQTAGMLDAGLSGGFFHSRPGLVTEYLGEAWFAALDAVLAVATERDGYLWLYDDDCWPSGSAGGLVSALRDDYRAALLQARLLAPGEALPAQPDADARAAYAVRRTGTRLVSLERLPLPEALAPLDRERLVLQRVYAPRNFLCWGNETPANLLNPEAVQYFISLTHDAYLRHYGPAFGQRIPAIFTDEPGCDRGESFPWYDGLPELYQRWHGRDFWNDAPLLFFDGPQDRALRLLLHRTVLRQFCEAYSKPLYDWCERHGLRLTGHYVGEDTLVAQVRAHGGGVMAHYRYLHMPGCDQVGRQREAELLTLKQTSSAARQLGRPQVLTELFAGLQHSCTFEEFKWVGDYHLALGATFLCPHLSWYSLRGRRKQDYPPNWNYQQTYWPDLRQLTDYFTRLGYALSSGQAQVEVLLLHPIDSAVAGRRLGVTGAGGGWREEVEAATRYDGALRHALEAILTAGYDCDLGDEDFLAESGAVTGNRLTVGQMSYSLVVVPPSRTWRPTTLALLRRFQQQGGQLLFIGEIPTEVDGQPDPVPWQELSADAATVPCARAHIQQAVERHCRQSFSLRSSDGQPMSDTYLQHRKDGEQEWWFLINADRHRAADYVLALPAAAGQALAEWNPVDGSCHRLAPPQVGQNWRHQFSLPPAGSSLLVVGPQADEDAAPAREFPDLASARVIPLGDRWGFARSEPNVLVIDRLSASVDGGATWWEEEQAPRVRWRLMRHFGTVGSQECQPWIAARKRWFRGKGGEVRLRYRVDCSAPPPPSISLVVEQAGELFVNGQAVDTRHAGWHWDRELKKVEITGLLHLGENTLEQRVAFDYLAEIEPLYLLGDFGVRLTEGHTRGEMGPEPPDLNNGSWVDQGYPFYTGRMLYRQRFAAPLPGRRLFLRLRQALGTLFYVRVNGAAAGSLLWRPHVVELTEALQDGENQLEIEVVSSLQNTFGPLHAPEADDANVTDFNPDTALPGFSLFPYGLLDGAELLEADGG